MQDTFGKAMADAGAKPVSEIISNDPPPAVIPAADPPPNADPPPAAGTPPVAGEPNPQGPKYIAPHEVLGDEFKDKDWESVKPEITTRLKRLSEVETENETLKKTPPSYFNDNVAQYDAWLRNGGVDDFDVFNKVRTVAADISDIDAMVTNAILKNPALKGLDADVREDILAKYQIEVTDENKDKLTEGQARINKANLKVEADKARSEIKEMQAKFKYEKPAAVDQNEVVAKRVEAWTPMAEAIIADFKTIPVPFEKREGEKGSGKEKVTNEIFMEIPIPEGRKAEYKTRLIDAYSKITDPTPESRAKADLDVRRQYLLENLPFIVSELLDKQETDLWDKWSDKFGGGARPKTAGSSSAKQSKEDEGVAAIRRM